MAGTYFLPDFVRVIDLALLAEYCSHRGLNFAPTPPIGVEKSFEQFIRFMEALSEVQRNTINAEFHSVNDITSNQGIQIMIEEATSKGLSLPEEIEEWNEHEKALWFYIHQRPLIEAADIWESVQKPGGKNYVYLGTVPIDQMKGKAKDLSQALNEYFVNILRTGRYCDVVEFMRDQELCYVAYPEGYAESDIAYIDGILDKKQIRKPVARIFFYYNLRTGRLATKSYWRTKSK